MKNVGLILFLVFASVFGVNFSVCAAEYHLGAGDVLSISVWGFDEFEVKNAIIGSDGSVDFPVIGELKVVGISSNVLAENIALRLKKYMRDPKVSVIITKYRTTRVYVFGEVYKPGMYEIDKQCNILDALGIAGGYTDRAAKKNLFVIRKEQQGEALKVNLLNLLRKGDMTQNYALGDGDVLYLTSNNKIDINSVLSLSFTKGNATYSTGYNGK